MNWEKVPIISQTGQKTKAIAPVIISASRATDIPAFYPGWFTERLKAGYTKWENPFNKTVQYISFSKARLVVFWSKNPEPLISHLDVIREKIPNYYFQFTLNDYEDEKLEPNVPEISKRIETFIRLSEKTGKNKLIWRFDPLILTDTTGIGELLRKVENIGDHLKNHTSKLVFSFVDINNYQKVQNNLKKEMINCREFTESEMDVFAAEVQKLNKKWGLEIGSCGEKVSLEQYGIIQNKCIDDDLIVNLFSQDNELMQFLGIEINQQYLFNPGNYIKARTKNKDKGQRKFCNCIASKDIGEYNTCPHLCKYCYANTSEGGAVSNWRRYLLNKSSETITGGQEK